MSYALERGESAITAVDDIGHSHDCFISPVVFAPPKGRTTMRFSLVTILMLTAAVAVAQPTQPTSAPTTQPVSNLPLMSLDLPAQVVDGWHERSNPQGEAAELQEFPA